MPGSTTLKIHGMKDILRLYVGSIRRRRNLRLKPQIFCSLEKYGDSSTPQQISA